MKFISITLSALVGLSAFALAAPQSATSVSPAEASQSAINTCIKKCNPGDVNCQAACQGLPTPDASAVDATTACDAACPQGNGSASDTAQYAACQAACVSSLYFTASHTSAYVMPTAATLSSDTGAATTTAAGAASTGATSAASGASGAAATGSSGTAGATNTASGTSGSPSGTSTSSTANASSTNSGANLAVNLPAAGIIGAFIALLAL